MILRSEEQAAFPISPQKSPFLEGARLPGIRNQLKKERCADRGGIAGLYKVCLANRESLRPEPKPLNLDCEPQAPKPRT